MANRSSLSVPTTIPSAQTQYLNAREQAALQGQVFNPQVGFTLVGNTAHPSKYPYNPFYGEWSPRIAAAWDVFGDGRTVIRGGYGRTYGRLNGVDLVLVPLLGTGLIQPVQCIGALSNGTCGTSSRISSDQRVSELARTDWSPRCRPRVRPCPNRCIPA